MGYKEVVHNQDFVAIENQFLVNDISQLSNALKEIGLIVVNLKHV